VLALRLPRRELSPYRVYLILEAGTSFLLGIAYATIIVYWVTAGRLNPLQLLLLGTGLELSYFVFQLPTGVLADIVSRRLCVLSGLLILGLALLLEGASAAFGNLLAAQFVLGLGYALNNGAQEAWIADELAAGTLEDTTGAAPGGTADLGPGEPPIPAGAPLPGIGPVPARELAGREMTGVYLRATQLGLAGTVAGSLLSGFIAAGGLNLPLIVGGALMCVLAGATALVMPERDFRRAGQGHATAAAGTATAARGIALITRQSRQLLAVQTRATHRAIVAVPGLVLLFAMTTFAGLWSESFDRLWGALLIRDIGIPRLGGLSPAIWFSLLAGVVAVLALGSTELARRRADRLGADSVASALLAITAAIAVGVIVMAVTRSFAVAVAAYLLISVLRPVTGPLIDGWMVTRIEPSVRATALSARDMFDSGGQIIGGPVIGLIGTLTSIRVALLAGAAALAPALACLTAASRRIRPRASEPARAAPGGQAGGQAGEQPGGLTADGSGTAASAGPGLPR
jgi:MFS transporter, DHA3 family, tetracycline resistance protein